MIRAMLTNLQIINFAIIDHLDLDFQEGLTVITGETGAGKSIIIDALAVVLGGRTDNTVIRTNQLRCDISATFNTQTIPLAKHWLLDNEYYGAELQQQNQKDSQQCIIRRILYQDGRSRVTINGFPCTLQQLRDFTPLLVNIHSQNQQQLLIKKSYQRELLDNFANNKLLRDEITNIYCQWRETQKKLAQLQETQKLNSHLEFLCYQMEELDRLALTTDEYENLDHEHKQLANAEQLTQNCLEALTLLSKSEQISALDLIYNAQQPLENIKDKNSKIQQILELLSNAIILIEESCSEIRNYQSQIEINPEKLQFVEQRLEKIHELARKHHVAPQALTKLHENLQNEIQSLQNAETYIGTLQNQLVQLAQDYQLVAKQLSQKRYEAAQKLDKVITSHLERLGMPGGSFKISLQTQESEMTAYGREQVEFLVSANPGQPLQPLHKVASGGELSRIALAIYVVTAKKNTTPVLIFDEVDVGIGGSTAAIVGQLLRSLAASVQIFCITHLAQVAAYGQQHLRADKQIVANQTLTQIQSLEQEQRTAEIARMLGGMTITDKTLAHASELLTCDQDL
jgi:DNA repair protein RecN (Recombination protein N)